MTTKQILDEMEKEFDEKFVRPDGEIDEYADDVNDFIRSYTRKLIEAVAEEIVGRDQTSIHTGHEIDDDYCIQCETFVKVHPMGIYGRNKLRAEQRLKVKEIINSLEK